LTTTTVRGASIRTGSLHAASDLDRQGSGSVEQIAPRERALDAPPL